MKKITNNIISKTLLLFLFIITQMPVWANEVINSEKSSDASLVFAEPKFWIGVVLFIGFIVAFFVVGKEKKQKQLQ